MRRQRDGYDAGHLLQPVVGMPIRLLRGVALALLLLPALASAQTSVYRWVDASGQVHFSQTPPPGGRDYDLIKGGRATPPTPDPGPGDVAADAQDDQRARERRFLEEAEAERKAKAEQKEKEKTERAQAEQKCTAARERVTFLEERTARRLVIKADDGNYARMPEDEFLERLEAARKDVAEHCR